MPEDAIQEQVGASEPGLNFLRPDQAYVGHLGVYAAQHLVVDLHTGLVSIHAADPHSIMRPRTQPVRVCKLEGEPPTVSYVAGSAAKPLLRVQDIGGHHYKIEATT